MPIVKRSDVDRHLKELRKRVAELEKCLVGEEPNTNLSDHYALNPDDFKRDFVTIDKEGLEYALDDLATVIKVIKRLPKQKAPKLHR